MFTERPHDAKFGANRPDTSFSPSGDVELQLIDDPKPASARDRLLTTLFAPHSGEPAFNAHHAWCAVYAHHLQQQLQTRRPEFEPLFRACWLEWPPTTIDRTAHSFLDDQRRDISINETIARLCEEHGSDFDALEEKQLHCSRKAIFAVISWLTMLFHIPPPVAADDLQIVLPVKLRGFCVQQSVNEACLPFVRVLRGFGPLLPTLDEVASMVESPSPSFMHATRLNIGSLIQISQIRIV